MLLIALIKRPVLNVTYCTCMYHQCIINIPCGKECCDMIIYYSLNRSILWLYISIFIHNICFYHMYDCLYFLFFLIIYYQNIYYIYINHFDTFFIENHVIISVSFICVECFGFGLESPSIQCTRSRDCMVINRPSCLIYLKNDIPGINFLSINNYIMEKCHLF